MSLQNPSSRPSGPYFPLSDSDEIRLLLLQPGSAEGALSCTLEHFKLSDRPPYEAVSYMWGSPDVQKPVRIGESDFFVRENLWHAFYCLRLKERTRYLWIDAICINQDDVSERNHQVNQMGEIYKSAKRVVIWLETKGSETLGSQFLVHVVGRAARSSEGSTDPEESGSGSYFESRRRDSIDILYLRAVGLYCSRQYWNRLWIVQEILMASRIVIQLGEDEIQWEDLLGSVNRLGNRRRNAMQGGLEDNRLGPERQRIVRSIKSSNMERLCREWGQRRRKDMLIGPNSSETPLLLLCSSFGHGKCEKVIDKVFALHGLATQCCRDAVPVDYSQSWASLCAAVVKHHMKAHNEADGRDLSITAVQEFHQRLDITQYECTGFTRPKLPLQEVASRRLSLARLTRGRQIFEFVQTRIWILKIPSSKHMPDGIVHVKGNLRGRITLTSGSLAVHGEHHDPLDSTVRSKLRLLPFPTDLQRDQLRYITNLAFSINGPRAKHRHVTTEVDIVTSFDKTQSWAIAAADCSVRFPTYVSDPRFWDPRLHERALKLPYDDTMPDQISKLAREAVRGTTAYKSKLAFEENGLICFVPESARAEDMICQFSNSNILVVVRPVGRLFQIVGRAVNFLVSPPTKAFRVCGMGVTNALDVRACPLSLFVDIRTLQLMTVHSLTPDSAAREPKGVVVPVEAMLQGELRGGPEERWRG